MTTAAVTRRSIRGDHLAGLGTIIRLILRRERIFLGAWVLGLGAVGVSSLSAIATLYPDPAGRIALAQGVAVNPAVLLLTGPVPSPSVGGLTVWRIGVLGGVMVALMAIFLVIRRTRGDEEAGRTELLASGVLGRATPLVAAVTLAWSASLVVGAVVYAAATFSGENSTGALVFGASWAGVGIVFAGIAGIAAQLFDSARAASTASGTALGIAFGLRAVGDLVHPLSFLAWLSPLGWLERAAAFGGNHIAVLALFPGVGVAAAAGGIVLLYRRDIGLALFPARLGPEGGPQLRSPLALAARLDRPGLLGWTIGFLAFGGITGAVADSAGDLLKDNPKMIQILAVLGGPGTLINAFLAAVAAISGLLAGAAAIAVAARVTSEESSGRLEPLLATGAGRTRVLGGHLLFVAAVPAVGLTVAGLASGLVHGIRSGDVGAGLGAGLSAMTVQIPAAIVMGALAAALVGVAPRLVTLGWAALAIALVLGQLGKLLNLPRALMSLSPYSHVPALPIAPMDWGAEIALIAVATVLFAIAQAGFRRRDIG